MGGGGPGRRALEGELQKGGRRGPWKASSRRVGGGGPGRRARWCSKIEKRRAGMN